MNVYTTPFMGCKMGSFANDPWSRLRNLGCNGLHQDPMFQQRVNKVASFLVAMVEAARWVANMYVTLYGKRK